jgi:hypothetical protein
MNASVLNARDDSMNDGEDERDLHARLLGRDERADEDVVLLES